MDVGIIGHAHKCNTDSTSYSVGWEREREELGEVLIQKDVEVR